MGGRAAGFRPAVDGGVGRLSPGSDWETDCPDFGPTALRSPMMRCLLVRSHSCNLLFREPDKCVYAAILNYLAMG